MNINILIPFFDDLECVKRCVDSIPGRVPIHLADGRVKEFPGEYNTTPYAEKWAGTQPNVTYHAPPPDQRPFGSDWFDADPEIRHGHMRKAAWEYYHLLPQNEWVVKLDADEMVANIDIEAIEQLNQTQKYSANCWIVDEGEDATLDAPGRWVYPDRIAVPMYWTYWLDDQSAPRDIYPRTTDAAQLKKAVRAGDNELRHGGTVDEDILTIINNGQNRSAEYRNRRHVHKTRIYAEDEYNGVLRT